MQPQTIQILTNEVQMLILCLSYLITTVPPIPRSLGISLGNHLRFHEKIWSMKKKLLKARSVPSEMITLHRGLLGPCHFPIFHNFRKTWCITPFYIGEMIFFSDKGRIKYYIIHNLMWCPVKVIYCKYYKHIFTRCKSALQFTWLNDPTNTVEVIDVGSDTFGNPLI